MAGTKVKVIHIITRLDKGGSAENTMLTVLDQARRGYEVMLVRGNPRESSMSAEEERSLESSLQKAAALGVKVMMIPSLIRRIHLIQDLRAFWVLLMLIRREKPDIVHTHTSKAGILGRLAVKLAGVSRLIHTPHGHVFYGHFGRIKSAFFTFLERIFAPVTDRIITLTQQGTEEHLQFGVGKRHQFVSIASGVDLPLLYRRSVHPTRGKEKLGFSSACLLVGTVGKLVPIKGHATLISSAIEVTRSFPSARFVIVGEGPLEGSLRHQGETLSTAGLLHFVKAWGVETWDWIAGFDLFVLPSLNEGMGRVLIEAMAFGKAVVASRVGGVPDIVEDGKTGILVPPGDPKQLSEAILRLLKDQDLARRMGEEGKNRGDIRFSSDAMVSRIDEVYRVVLRGQQ